MTKAELEEALATANAKIEELAQELANVQATAAEPQRPAVAVIADIRRGPLRRIKVALDKLTEALKETTPEFERFLAVRLEGQDEYAPHPAIAEFNAQFAAFRRTVNKAMHPPTE